MAGPGDWVLLYEPHPIDAHWHLSGLGRVSHVFNVERGPEPEDAEHVFYYLQPAAKPGGLVGPYGTIWRASETRPVWSRSDLAQVLASEHQDVRELAMRAAAQMEDAP